MPQLVSSRVPGDDRDAQGELILPVYVDLGDRRVLASFGQKGGHPDSLEVRRDRARSYPVLSSGAPRTDAIYRAFAPYARGKVALDIGMGSGAGLSLLSEARRHLGVDVAELAVRFASRSFARAEYHRLDATREALPSAEVAFVVDVLGEVSMPLELLRRAAAAVGEGGLVCVAEPSANIAQELEAPMVRAFSRAELEGLLAEAGLAVEEWLSEGRFWVTAARRQSSEWTRGLEAADQFLAAGLFEEASELLQRSPRAPGAGLEAGWFLRLFQAEQALGRGDQALRALMLGHERSPDDARILATLSEASLTLGSIEDAERFARAALDRDPGSAAAHRVLAESLRESDGPGTQIARLSGAVKLDPSNVELAVKLAITAADAEIYSVGVKALERVREYHSVLSADFHLTLGWLYLVTGRIDEALVECKVAGLVAAQHPGVEELMLAICEARPNPLGLA